MKLLLIIVVVLGGCTLHHVKEEAPAPVKLPASFSSAGDGAPDLQGWWRELPDATFHAYAERLVRDNLDLKRAFARLNQVRALARQTGAARLPQVDARAGASTTQNVFSMGDTFGDQTVASSRFPLDVTVAYEADLWGRVAASVRAVHLDIAAGEEDRRALAQSLVTRAARLWFGVREQQAHLVLLDAQERTIRDYIQLIALRIKQGMATSLDMLQQEQALAALHSRRPRYEAAIRVSRHQLAILAGLSPTTHPWEQEVGLPSLGDLPAGGLPSGLLKDRPDLRSALKRLYAADHRVGAAIAAQWPALRLGGSAGLSGSETSNILTSWVYSLAANLVAPLFDGGRRAAEVSRSRATLDERVQLYGQAVLRALGEVEDALAREQAERQTLTLFGSQMSAAKRTLAEATRRYRHGLGSYLPVLAALRSRQELEHQQLSALGRAWGERFALNLALGGSWQVVSPSASGAGAGHE